VGVSTEGEDLKPRDENGRARQRNAVREFVAEMSPDYPILLNGDSISHAYGGLDSLPTSFFLNKDGVVVASQIGIRSESDIETNIRKALGLSTQAHETSQP
jgi:cytochrome c biogenesis protein CcmG/thiol:disulfide interchange protein DsbE